MVPALVSRAALQRDRSQCANACLAILWFFFCLCVLTSFFLCANVACPGVCDRVVAILFTVSVPILFFCYLLRVTGGHITVDVSLEVFIHYCFISIPLYDYYYCDYYYGSIEEHPLDIF